MKCIETKSSAHFDMTSSFTMHDKTQFLATAERDAIVKRNWRTNAMQSVEFFSVYFIQL